MLIGAFLGWLGRTLAVLTHKTTELAQMRNCQRLAFTDI